MSIITISRGSYSRGKEVAELLAKELGYACVSRDVLLEASDQFNIPEVKLVRAIHDAPSILERFTYGKEQYIRYIRAAFLKHMQGDNIVYHGLAGHVFLQGVPHVLKVRIIADMEDRVREEMKRENISATKARQVLMKDDGERRKWSMHLYGIDAWDPRLYDLTLHLGTIGAHDAVDLIALNARLPSFQTTSDSQEMLDNLTLSAHVEAAIAPEFHRVNAVAEGGIVSVAIGAPLNMGEAAARKAEAIAMNVPGVKAAAADVTPLEVMARIKLHHGINHLNGSAVRSLRGRSTAPRQDLRPGR